MFSYTYLINECKKNRYHIIDIPVMNAKVAIRTTSKNTYSKVIVLCDNSNDSIFSDTNIEEIEKVIKNVKFLDPRKTLHCLYIILNDHSKYNFKKHNTVCINRYTHAIKHTGIDKELSWDYQFVEYMINEHKAAEENANIKLGIPKEPYRIKATYVLIALNLIAYFILRNANKFGINGHNLFSQKEHYRLLTYMFTHAGIFHLIGNMTSLYAIGRILEKNIGAAKMFCLYFISGVYGGIITSLVHGNNITVGASGAVCGLLAALLIETLSVQPCIRTVAVEKIVISITVIIISGLFMEGRVDTICHIGGMIGGALFMKIFNLCDKLEATSRHVVLQRKINAKSARGSYINEEAIYK